MGFQKVQCAWLKKTQNFNGSNFFVFENDGVRKTKLSMWYGDGWNSNFFQNVTDTWTESTLLVY
jgi:hypothetical protein